MTIGGYGFGGEGFLRLLFDPASLLPVLDIAEAKAETYIGRPAIEVTALPRLDVDLVHVDWHYATKHRLVVDAESGILLRYETWLDDDKYMQWDLLEIHLNEDLPDDFFIGPADSALVPMPRGFAAEPDNDFIKEIQELMERRFRDAGKPPDSD